ncbi:NADH dehydrogenase [ubiquinone] 1 alpha subcomplex subunit 3-like [Peromyscus californicus insignis]|uniref:NADH dehydrogenase [ubiquinone] 1 alpha subcomplex subunit 3-like n=1 Tax=Peromyscus californicus insignis TaxID=564181 RepID=UPI0022A7430A|nr:NADH dehydrogenase [ubiquinone] 1 alpha subcomplex subunit 3-like [Peromyscus californicus insignis]
MALGSGLEQTFSRLVVSFSIWGLAVIMPIISPYTKYSGMINRATPYVYPVPVRDNGNMPDVPSHPQDPQGPNLEWLKNLWILLLMEEAPFPVAPQ